MTKIKMTTEQKSEPSVFKFYANATYNGKPISAEEFYELAEKNNALHTPEQAEKARQETINWIERYQIHTGWLGGLYFIDTHSTGYKCWLLFWCILGLLAASVLFLFVFMGMRESILDGSWGTVGVFILACLLYAAFHQGSKK